MNQFFLALVFVCEAFIPESLCDAQSAITILQPDKPGVTRDECILIATGWADSYFREFTVHIDCDPDREI